MSWASEEMKGARLGDERLNRRAVRILEGLGNKPTPSIPAALGGWAETQAAYRFFSNEKVSADLVLAPHTEATLVRCRQEAVVLCVDDTTELDFNGRQDIVGLGPLSYPTQRGLYLHLTLAITPERLALGVLAALPWARDLADYGKSAEHAGRPIEEKESIRWLESYRAVSAIVRDRANPNTQFVYVADRESDIYDIFAEAAHPDSADFLLRAMHDRNLASGGKLRHEVRTTEALGEVEFDLKARPERPARRVVATLRSARLRLKCPDNKTLPDVEVTVLHAREEHPPQNVEKPVEWFLLTSFLASDFDEVAELFQWYLCRWDIEVFFRVLKSGCKVEDLQLEHADRIEAALAIYLIVAWRVLYLMRLGRTCPEMSCEAVFTTDEWQTLFWVAKRKQPPKEPLTLNQMIRLVASFGGFLGRKGDGEPGPKTLWIGLQRLRDFVAGAHWARSVDKTYV